MSRGVAAVDPARLAYPAAAFCRRVAHHRDRPSARTNRAMRQCLRCAWPELDSPPDSWLTRPLSYKLLISYSSLIPGDRPSTTKEGTIEARRRVLAVAHDRTLEGLCTGITHWCGRCRRVTLLVKEGWDDAAEAILDTLQHSRHLHAAIYGERLVADSVADP
eukprot:216863-Hanusia_phi.AAC.3